MQSKSKISDKIIVPLFLLLGFLYRMAVIGINPQGFMFDQWEYHRVAEGILANGLFVSSYRVYGYPLLLAGIYRFFGTENALAWQFVNVVLDTVAGYLVYLLAHKLFRNAKLAVAALILYLVNPFTSAYTGVRLTEIPATFLVTLIIYLLFVLLEKKKAGTLLVLSLVLGFVPQVRPSFIIFSVGVFLYVLSHIAGMGRHRIALLITAIVLYVLPYGYNVVGNYRYFEQFSPLTVNNLFVREFYIGLYTGNGDLLTVFPQEVQNIYNEYTSMAFPAYNKAMAEKYWSLGLEKIHSDWGAFITSRFQKMWYVWQKYGVYPYTNPSSKLFGEAVYWGNLLFLLIAFTGLIAFMRSGAYGRVQRRVGMVTIGLIIYITVLHAFTFTTGRFSLPAYPMLCVFAVFGGWRIWEKIRELKNEAGN